MGRLTSPSGVLRTWSTSKPMTAMPLPLKRATMSAGSGICGSPVQNTSPYVDEILEE